MIGADPPLHLWPEQTTGEAAPFDMEIARKKMSERKDTPPSSSMSEEEIAESLAYLTEYADRDQADGERRERERGAGEGEWHLTNARHIRNGAAALAALSPRPLPHEDMRGKALEEAAKRVIAEKFSTYKARNGRHVGVQDESGEMCWIIGHEAIFDLEEAIRALPLSHGGKG